MAIASLTAMREVNRLDAWSFLTTPFNPVVEETVVITSGKLPRVLAAAVSCDFTRGFWIHVGALSEADHRNFDLAANGFTFFLTDVQGAIKKLKDVAARIGSQPPAAGSRRRLIFLAYRYGGVVFPAIYRRSKQALVIWRFRRSKR